MNYCCKYCKHDRNMRVLPITTHLFKYIENNTTKNWKISEKKSDIFYISAQNIDCLYENTPIQIYRKFHLQKLKFFR